MAECICTRFSDTGDYRIADLGCPIHGVDGTNPGDGPWDDETQGVSEALQPGQGDSIVKLEPTMTDIPADHPAVKAALDGMQQEFVRMGYLLPTVLHPRVMAAALTAALPLLAPSDKTLLAKALGEMGIAYSRAVEALREYGTHDSDCPMWDVGVFVQVDRICTCGFNAALRDLGSDDD